MHDYLVLALYLGEAAELLREVEGRLDRVLLRQGDVAGTGQRRERIQPLSREHLQQSRQSLILAFCTSCTLLSQWEFL